MSTREIRSLRRRLSVLRAEAVGKGVPADLAEAAMVATLEWGVRQPAAISAVRAGAYFWTVVRKRAFSRTNGHRGLRNRFIVASAIEDMRSAGIAEDRIRDEVRRCYGVEIGAGIAA